MNRFAHVLLILLCFELGVLLVFLPWSVFWERNFFLQRYPVMIPWILNPYGRGLVSGLGVLDILIAGGMIRRWLLLPSAAAK
jgi:hypothetical protein